MVQSSTAVSFGSVAPADPARVITLTGVVKWFDAIKGFGFVIPDNGMPDVLLHITYLQRAGYLKALQGARIECETRQWSGGWRVSRVISMDESTAVVSVPSNVRARPGVGEASEPEPAWCKWFNTKKGFGFLTRGDGTEDVFVHIDTLRQCGMGSLRKDQPVLVRYARGPKGLLAVGVEPATRTW
jgi:CspA family cold shock protein